MDTPPLLEASGIGRRFGAVRALHGVGLTIRAGEVVALLGENGAGKSTLMKILAGVESPDHGTLRVDGRVVVFRNVADALAAGIALIHQELNLADNLDIAGNVFLGREPRRGALIDRAAMRRETARLLGGIGLDAGPDTPVSALSIGRRQQVEIAKALAVDARVLIMDEPTSSLSNEETTRLFEVIARLKARGVAVVYISHRLGEVRKVADRVVVLRDGEPAGELARHEIDHDAMVRLMVGRNLAEYYPRRASGVGPARLTVEGLKTAAHPDHSVSFSVRGGEIVALAGLVGAGRSELLRTIFGVDRRLAGRVVVDGRSLRGRSVGEAMSAGLALVPEERQSEGLVMEMDMPCNVSLAVLARDARHGVWLNRRREQETAGAMAARLRIKAAASQTAALLSGGNQQKVVLAKWLATGPRVMLLDEPTRGVDIGARHDLYEWMERLAGEGVAVLFASSDLTEVLGMADRVLVMHEGRLTGELPRGRATEESVMRLATGSGGSDNSEP